MSIAYLSCALVALAVVALAPGMWKVGRRQSVFRRELPRIYELADVLSVPLPAGAYFYNLDGSFSEIPQKLKQYRDIERDLQGLDPVAWAFLKSELKPLLATRDPKRGWQPLFDKLNQAKGYNHLKTADIRTSPSFRRLSSRAKGRRTCAQSPRR
jgi:hypothetical protein